MIAHGPARRVLFNTINCRINYLDVRIEYNMKITQAIFILDYSTYTGGSHTGDTCFDAAPSLTVNNDAIRYSARPGPGARSFWNHNSTHTLRQCILSVNESLNTYTSILGGINVIYDHVVYVYMTKCAGNVQSLAIDSTHMERYCACAVANTMT
jgi:hypothetical protein